jgi:DNA repair protein RecN (Recombination protein N)
LVKVASGGEISRLLLAIRSAQVQQTGGPRPALLLDEVDTGIGGRTASMLGTKLKKLSEGGQVVVVTHLHQIARQADHHFAIEKARATAGRNVIKVRRLKGKELAAELERMVALPIE